VSEPTSLPAAVVADTIVRTVELGVTITDAAVDGDVTVVFCNLLDDGRRHCPGCGGEGIYRDTVVRTVTDVPVVGHPLRLRVRVPRYRCTATGCEREVFAHNTSALARPGWSTTRRYARYILRRLMIDRATVAAVARELGLSWDTVNTIAMDATRMIIAADTGRLDGVRVIGVDEHRWSHTRRPGDDGYVTVIIDLTPVLEGTGRARLLDLVPGRSAAALTSWLSAQTAAFRDPGRHRRDGRVRRLQDRGHPGLARRHRGDGPLPCSGPSPGTSSICAANASNNRPAVTVAAPGIRSTGYGAPYAPDTRCPTIVHEPGCTPCSPTRTNPRRRTLLGLLPASHRRLRTP
jgi:hypothetical protein